MGPAPLPDNTPPSGPPTPPPTSPPSPPAGPAGPPPPPPPQIDIRTMASDAQSLRTSGGLGAEPKTFSPADLSKEPVFGPEIVSPVAAGAAKAGGAGKKLAITLGVIAVLALAAGVGYFFVWPLFSGEEAQPITEIIPPPLLPTEPAAPALTHQSFFTNSPAGGSKEASLASLTLSQLSSALKAASGEATSTGIIKEVILTSEGKSLSSVQALELVLPGGGLEAYVESDVTVYAYYANGKSYPGYIFKLKSDADTKAAEAAAVKIESSANLAALYPESPGASKGGWKSGSVSGVSTRYQAYSSAGASLNYGWVSAGGESYLVISTSFDGFKKALDLLK